MSVAIDEMVRSLLYEGYALYPYTPGATKNATPTPFGIVYPPTYAAGSGATFDHLQVECQLVGSATQLEGEVLFLQPTGERHEAVERRVRLAEPGEATFEYDGLCGRVTLEVEPGDPSKVRLRVENLTEAPEGSTRAEALQRSLVSTHCVIRAPGARFVSPLDAVGCENVNTWPVLVGADDDAVLGAAIFLPDHPRIAPESRGDLFDGTEIEEALLLHVHALSDGEREAIAAQDSPVRELVARASATTGEEIMRLHGALRPAAPEPRADLGVDPRVGEAEATVDGRTFRPGGKVVLRLGTRTDPYDQILDGRTASLERIYLDYDGRVYLGVTIDTDPMQEVMRETGRYHFFFADEVELLGESHDEGRNEMGEQEEHKGALDKDNPEPADTTDKGLGGETGGDRGPNEAGSGVLDQMPESRGEVRYGDDEDQQEREDAVPVEGGVDTDPDWERKDASSGVKD